jgi:uncharacterized hydantoinase/oxoprolinase family protein
MLILSGHGDFLLRRAINESSHVILLRDQIGREAARCAPAYAVAILAEEAAGRGG